MQVQHSLSDDDRLMSNELYELVLEMGRRTAVGYVPVEELESRPVNLDVAIDINRLLDELKSIHPHWCTAVELKCFQGFTDQEAAEALAIPCSQVRNIFCLARLWLRDRMEANAAKK